MNSPRRLAALSLSLPLPRRIAVAVSGAAIALSLVGVGQAQAGFPTGPLPVAPIHVPIGVLKYLAPTDNLSAIANSLQLKDKSTTTEVTVPAGLGVTNPVSVKVSYGRSDLSYAVHSVGRAYDDSTGLDLIYAVPNVNTRPPSPR